MSGQKVWRPVIIVQYLDQIVQYAVELFVIYFILQT